MTPDAWVVLALGAFGASGYVVGWCAGYGRAESLWRSRERARRYMDARSRHPSVHRHERTPLTAAELAEFRRIAQEETP